MVLTRSQARLYQYYGQRDGENTTDSIDSEVSFGPAYFDHLFLGGRPDTPATHNTTAESMDGGDNRHERRLQLLESTVMGMTEKFDSLLLQVNPSPRAPYGPPPAPHQAASRSADLGQHGGHAYQVHRPAPLDPRLPPYADYVAEQLRREEMHVPRVDDGKPLAQDAFIKTLIPKPYMYLERPGAGTIKKKLELRETMTFHEYLVCYIKMVRDPRAGLAKQSDTLMEHLQQVVEDAATRDWPSVRRWSQVTFDAIENGTYDWADRHQIQFERLRHDLLAARSAAQRQSQYPQHNPQDRRDLPCRDYNQPSGCGMPRTHVGRTVNFVHLCSVCFQAGDRIQHPAYACNRRAPPPGTSNQLRQAPLPRPQLPLPKNGVAAAQMGAARTLLTGPPLQ